MSAAPLVCSNNQFRSQVAGLSEPGEGAESERPKSAMGRGYNLHSTGERVCLFGSDLGFVFAESDWLGAGQNIGIGSGSVCIEDGDKSWPYRSWAGTPFRSRISICISGLY